MRFKDIELINYRCFDHAKLSFEEKDDKTINIIVGENGAGKTELLFAFQWALYGFDFSKLQGKKTTIFSLNSNLYNKLSPEDLSYKPKSIVIVNIEADSTIYTITTTETFFYKHGKIISKVFRKVNYKNSKNESIEVQKTNEKDSDYDKIINKLIPIKVLNGLLFDGEKMKELTSFSTTNKAVEGIIEEITSSSNIDSMNNVYKNIKRKNNRELSSLNMKIGNFDLAKKIEEQSKLSDEIDSIETQIKNDTTQLGDSLISYEVIESKLAEYEDNNKYISKRKQNEELIKEKKSFLKTFQKNIISTISSTGYLLLADSLFKDTRELLNSSQLPKGLNSEAVQSIIDSKICLCGEPLSEEKINKLKILKDQLPPLNINSTILESLTSVEHEKSETETRLRNQINEIRSVQKEITILESENKSLSQKIIQNTMDESLKTIESEKKELDRNIGKLNQRLTTNKNLLKEKKKNNLNLLRTINETSNQDKVIKALENKKNYCEKSIELINEWKENNKIRALKIINTKLLESYKLLSEDYKLGKRIIICQHDTSHQFQIYVYFQKALDSKLEEYKLNDKYSSLLKEGLSEDEIKEQAIIEIADANSQGQSEINTLSFVKAMMEYASAIKHEGLEVTRNYPLIIDSPFGQLSGDNLSNIAFNLSKFSNQVLLMVSPSRLEEVNDKISTKSQTKYTLIKSKETNATTVERG